MHKIEKELPYYYFAIFLEGCYFVEIEKRFV